MPTRRRDPRRPDRPFLDFWRERHLCTLTTLRPDGTPHVVPVGVTYDPDAGLARVLTSGTSRKAAHIRAAQDGPDGAPVAVCQFQGRHWATLEGRAVLRTEPELIADAEHRYAERYGHPPRPNPRRVLVEIALTGATGNV
ncbi:pyridoxamine 5'-phosphate oxidase family protein [Streptomyces sp. NPDC058045]|uniref:pyridoxamine 5'-phosphate oxidase family protein n=1 Tax=Streptomyces sp. NPDC058045 TaxID=3346311 RepID=UPI0036E85953